MKKNKINLIDFKKIKIISLISITSLSLIGAGIYSIKAVDKPNKCGYEAEIKRCVEANSSLSSGPRSIEDFVCISSPSKEKIVYNIVFDAKFKELDKGIQIFLESLEKNKDEYFGKSATGKTLFDAVKELNTIFSDETTGFYKQYSNLCTDNSIINETSACLNPGTVLNSSDFINDDSGDNLCMDLAKTKLAIFRQIGTDLLKTNKQQIKSDYQKAYMQKQRGKYNDLIDKMGINQNYVNKINNKWNVKCKDCN